MFPVREAERSWKECKTLVIPPPPAGAGASTAQTGEATPGSVALIVHETVGKSFSNVNTRVETWIGVTWIGDQGPTSYHFGGVHV